MLLEGDSFDKELQNSIEAKSKLFLIFYINNCPYCTHAIKVLKEDIIKNYEDEDEINFATVNLDKQSNIWLGVRFNITRIPYIILIEDKRMYLFQNQFEESVVLKFIEDEKNIEDSIDIPENVGIMNKANIIMHELTERIKNTMEILFGRFGIKIYWNDTMSYILLAVLLIFVIYFENKLILFIRQICRFDRNQNTKAPEKKEDNNDKEKNEKDKENKDKANEKKEKKE